jgi:hypothetical protein
LYLLQTLCLGYTVAPTFGTNKLMVNGNSSFVGSIFLQATPGVVGSGDLTILGQNFGRINIGVATCNGCFSSSAITGDAVIRGNNRANNSLILTNTGAGGIKFETQEFPYPDPNGFTKVQMVIDKKGNVGIGSLNPDEKLTVKGKIHAEEVRVDLLVPADYVFEKYYTGASALKADYVMPSLAEVEKFTKAKNHLPNVPSAQEIKDKGLQLGEMSNILLQKVEELTLYIIEQNKKIEALEAKVNGK